MKYFLLIALVIVLWWVWKKRNEHSDESGVAGDRPSEKMVACAYCGVHHPLSESLIDGEAHYCCPAHRLAGKSSGRP